MSRMDENPSQVCWGQSRGPSPGPCHMWLMSKFETYWNLLYSDASMICLLLIGSTLECGLLLTYTVPTYAHGVCWCVYIVIHGKEKKRGRHGETEAERVREREVQVSISWMAVLLWEQDVGSLFPKKVSSLLPSFPLSLSQSLITSFLSLLHGIHSICNYPSSSHFSRSHPTTCFLSHFLTPPLSSILSPPTHSPPPLSFALSTLLFATILPSVTPSSPLSFCHPFSLSLWSPCLFNTHLYSILFSVVMAIGWGREGARASKRAGVGVSEVTSLGQ